MKSIIKKAALLTATLFCISSIAQDTVSYIAYKYSAKGTTNRNYESPEKIKNQENGWLLLPVAVDETGALLANIGINPVLLVEDKDDKKALTAKPKPGLCFVFTSLDKSQKHSNYAGKFFNMNMTYDIFQPSGDGGSTFLEGSKSTIKGVTKESPELPISSSYKGNMVETFFYSKAGWYDVVNNSVSLKFDKKITAAINEGGPFANSYPNLLTAINGIAASTGRTRAIGTDLFLYGEYRVNTLSHSDKNKSAVLSKIEGSFTGDSLGSFTSINSNSDFQLATTSYATSDQGTFNLVANLIAKGSVEYTGAITPCGNILAFADTDAESALEAISVGIKKSTGMTDASLTGTFVGHTIIVQNGGTPEVKETLHTFNGDGTGTRTYTSSGTTYEIPTTYAMSTNGTTAIKGTIPTSGTEFTDYGILAPNGETLSLVDYENSYLKLMTLIKKSSGMTNASIKGDYTYLIYTVANDGASTASQQTLTFNGDGTGTNGTTSFTYSVNDDGSFSLTFAGAVSSISGMLNSNSYVFSTIDTDSSDGSVGYGIGILKSGQTN